MNLRELNTLTMNDLSLQLNEEGMVVLSGVELPFSFNPSLTDIVVLKEHSTCEVYISAEIDYAGQTSFWREAFNHPESPGGTRKIFSPQGDLFTVVKQLTDLFYLEADEESDSSGGTEGPERAFSGVVNERATRPGADGLELRDLVQEQQPGGINLIGRDASLRALKVSLLRKSKSGVLIVGPTGVGKTTLVRMLAYDIANGRDIPKDLKESKIYEVSLARYLSDYLEHSPRELLRSHTNVILFLDEFHLLVRPELSALLNALKPPLEDGSIRVIGATTTAEWRRISDGALKRRFVELRLDEPSPKEASWMLTVPAAQVAQHHALRIDERAIGKAVMLSHRYISGRSLPDKAVDIIDHAAAIQASAQCQTLSRDSMPRLDDRYLIEAVSTQAGVAKELIESISYIATIDRLTKALLTSIHGQEKAIQCIDRALRTRVWQRDGSWRKALREMERTWDTRPVASFLACGPTGVGKTETARTIASVLYEGRIIALNGADAGPEAPHATAMWTGSPPGYVGSQEGGILTNGLRETPTAVILIDELEKASPIAVQNVILPLLGEGIVIDRNNGERLSVTECVVFCTSNILVQAGGVGFSLARETPTPSPPEIHSALLKFLWPEVIGRFNAILTYGPLTLETRWHLWNNLIRATEQLAGPMAQIAVTISAEGYIKDKLRKLKSGARGIEDLFRTEVLPLVVDLKSGQRVEIRLTQSGLVVEPRAVT